MNIYTYITTSTSASTHTSTCTYTSLIHTHIHMYVSGLPAGSIGTTMWKLNFNLAVNQPFLKATIRAH